MRKSRPEEFTDISDEKSVRMSEDYDLRAAVAGKKVLFAASTGGHLAQLVRIADSIGPAEDSLWVTFRTNQSESLLAGRRVLYVPYVRPRDYIGVVRAARTVRESLKRESFDLALSTGAALALSVLPLAARRGIESTYVESVSRVQGPSLTGRLLQGFRRVTLCTQHPSWARGRWMVVGSVLTTYSASAVRPKVERPQLFVTLGTIEGYRFDSAIDAVLRTGLADERTVWQLGCSPRADLPGEVHEQMPAEQFKAEVRKADVVVTHAGVGSILEMLDDGIYPVAVPRLARRSEHVDDHQLQICGVLEDLEIGAVADTEELTADTLIEASRWAVRKSEESLA